MAGHTGSGLQNPQLAPPPATTITPWEVFCSQALSCFPLSMVPSDDDDHKTVEPEPRYEVGHASLLVGMHIAVERYIPDSCI